MPEQWLINYTTTISEHRAEMALEETESSQMETHK